jgi:hypothetical protein
MLTRYRAASRELRAQQERDPPPRGSTPARISRIRARSSRGCSSRGPQPTRAPRAPSRCSCSSVSICTFVLRTPVRAARRSHAPVVALRPHTTRAPRATIANPPPKTHTSSRGCSSRGPQPTKSDNRTPPNPPPQTHTSSRGPQQ